MKKLFCTFAVVMSAMILAVPAFAAQLRPHLAPVEATPKEIVQSELPCGDCGGIMYSHTERYEIVRQSQECLKRGKHWDTLFIERPKVGFKCYDCGRFDYEIEEKLVCDHCPKLDKR